MCCFNRKIDSLWVFTFILANILPDGKKYFDSLTILFVFGVLFSVLTKIINKTQIQSLYVD